MRSKKARKTVEQQAAASDDKYEQVSVCIVCACANRLMQECQSDHSEYLEEAPVKIKKRTKKLKSKPKKSPVTMLPLDVMMLVAGIPLALGLNNRKPRARRPVLSIYYL